MARPTKYDRSLLEKANEYIKACEDEETDWIKTSGDKSTSYEHRVKVKLPSIEGLALFLDVSRTTLYNWSEKHKEFLYTLRRIERIQKEKLISSGLSGDYSPVIAKLMLSSNHNMREKTDLTSDNEKLQPVLVKFIDGKDKDNTNSE